MPDRVSEAIALRDQYARDVDKIRNDSTLSDEGKRIKLAKAYTAMTAKVEALRKAQQDERTSRTATLERRVFGTGSDPAAVATYRDAVSRAEAVTDEEQARQLLDRAVRIGDTQLAKAVALVATERSYTRVWSSYADTLSGYDRTVFNELAELKRDGIDKKTERMTESMAFSLSKPRELSNVNRGGLDQLANS